MKLKQPQMRNLSNISILMADDDPDDRLLAKEAFEENKIKNRLYFVEDGEDLMNFLLHKGKYNKVNAPRPGLILLDLNMPKKDGREALREIKNHPELRRIPVIMHTTSKAEEDIIKSYDLGANSFITKSATFENMVSITSRLEMYWLETVELPK